MLLRTLPIVKNERSFYICDMPRVSEAHLAARRQQIIEAARSCFVRNGFHATSMQDVITEAGLSVGAVYRYFKSKNDIVDAIADQYAGQLQAAFASLVGEERPLIEIMQAGIGIIDAATGPDGAMRLAVQVWAEAMRDDRMAATAERIYTRFRGNFVEIARRAVRTGGLPAGTDPEAIGAALFSLILGHGLQKLLTGHPDREAYITGLRAILGAGNLTLQ
jgi:AcrR family transcriptional regulator